MQWYYANNGQRLGPISAAEFDRLVQEGVIRAETLVWREGMAEWKPYSALAAPATTGIPAGGSAAPSGPVDVEFTGAAGEYFKVWIVNVLLTIVTLGIYAAWAKVRNKRYFYSNTRILGHAFEYLANPTKILIGNIIVVVLFVSYTIAGGISPILQAIFMVLFAVAVPWFMVKALSFNARNSAWRGLRFAFHGRYGEAFLTFVILPIGVVLTLGLLFPYVYRRQRAFMMGQHALGTTSVSFAAQVRDFYRLFAIALIFFLPVIGGYVIMIGAAFRHAASGDTAAAASSAAGLTPLGGLLMLFGLPLAWAGSYYLRSRLFNLTWSNTQVGPHRIVASMRARDLFLLNLVNALAVIFTLGLAYPWTAIRTIRYQLSCLQILPEGSMDNFVAASQPEVGALGDAASDFFDFDFGFGI